jgi:hypothetical protein
MLPTCPTDELLLQLVGLKGNGGSILGSGEGSLVGVYIAQNLRRMDRGLLQPTFLESELDSTILLGFTWA